MARNTAGLPDFNASLDTYQSLVSAFTEFLTVVTHTILFERGIYPRDSFIAARKYDCPVRQSRHPGVCEWIRDAVDAVEKEMLKCTVESTAIVLFSQSNLPLERFVFNTASFPIVPPSESLTRLEYENDEEEEETEQPEATPEYKLEDHPLANLNAQFRATLIRLRVLLPKLSPIPNDCTFTIAIELRDQKPPKPPISPTTHWMASTPSLQRPAKPSSDEKDASTTRSAADSSIGADRGGKYVLPIRTLEAGAFMMDFWVEEGRAKFDGRMSNPSTFAS